VLVPYVVFRIFWCTEGLAWRLAFRRVMGSGCRELLAEVVRGGLWGWAWGVRVRFTWSSCPTLLSSGSVSLAFPASQRKCIALSSASY
jgi:hypothetical protein